MILLYLQLKGRSILGRSFLFLFYTCFVSVSLYICISLKQNSMESAKVVKEQSAKYFSVYNNGDYTIPVIANCPIENIEKALAMFGDNFTIFEHITKR